MEHFRYTDDFRHQLNERRRKPMSRSNLSELYMQIEESRIPFDMLEVFVKVKKLSGDLEDDEIESRVGIIYDCYSHDEEDADLDGLVKFVCTNYERCLTLPRTKILAVFHGRMDFDEIQIEIEDMELTN